jgi:hypothetical protein
VARGFLLIDDLDPGHVRSSLSIADFSSFHDTTVSRPLDVKGLLDA